MALMMKKMTGLSFLLTLLFVLLYQCYPLPFLLSLAITMAVTFYHFAMRLFIGFVFDSILDNTLSYKRRWFHVGKRECHFYEKIHVKQWKKYMPTYDIDAFDTKRHSLEKILMTMCQAELVHESIILFSFLPIFASHYLGAFWVFFITSILAAGVDLSFVVLQRYNRPRVERLMKKQKHPTGAKCL